MINRIQNLINTAEEAFLQSLEEFFTSIYNEERLISHGLGHHCRVWENAKELLQCVEYKENTFNQLFIQKLLMACFLHDIGMSIESGIKHGHHSREFCNRFLKEQNMKAADYQDLLSAIENHDNKDYDDPGNNDLLLTILSVADDLDAFGETGISRYLEIYQERGVEKFMVGQAIRENARKRFKNFERLYHKYPELIEKHRKRFLILDTFFKNNHLTTE